jgi:hypothetical protein
LQDDAASPLGESSEHRWQKPELKIRYDAAVAAMESSLAMGYLHHVELHERQALEWLRLDIAEVKRRA